MVNNGKLIKLLKPIITELLLECGINGIVDNTFAMKATS